MPAPQRPKFPRLIHVTRECPTNHDPWLCVHTDGVTSLDEAGQLVAVYQRVEVGRVEITKRFVTPKKRGRR